MNTADARLYLDASRQDPFVAAWVSVLDAHEMHHRTDIAPQDWESAFEDLFNLGFVSCAEFNSLDFKRQFRRSPPPPASVEAALSALAALRERNPLEETKMPKFDLFDHSSSPLSLTAADTRRPLSRHESFAPLAPKSPGPREIIAAPVKLGRALSPLASRAGSSSLATRAPADASPCRWGDTGDNQLVDPRAHQDVALKVICCGSEVPLEYAAGKNVTTEFSDKSCTMIDYVFVGVCPRCDGEHHHSIVRPMPGERVPR